MADLSCRCAGISAPNPFWLASGPPTDSADQVMRAFDAGWGGAVWKTLTDPAVVNTTARYGGFHINGAKLLGMSNIELITDRPLADNLKEIKLVKKRYPKHALLVSLMAGSDRKAWHDIVRRAEDTGCDGLELNLSCPHGMNERGMGAAIGQVPEYTKAVVHYAKEATRLPILVKLTPNVTDIRPVAHAAKESGADGVSLINTVNSLIGVDLDTLLPKPSVRGKTTHGGFSGPAIKPIALHMVSSIATDIETKGTPLSGVGGIANWRDAAEFMLLGCSSVQVCTAVMHHGFGIVEDMIQGLRSWMDEKRFQGLTDFVGKSADAVVAWKQLDLHHKTVARINRDKCIGCDLCYVACRDAARQCIEMIPASTVTGTSERKKKTRGSTRHARVLEDACIGCNLCALVCPVEGCVEMAEVSTGHGPLTWEQYTERGMKNLNHTYSRRLLHPDAEKL